LQTLDERPTDAGTQMQTHMHARIRTSASHTAFISLIIRLPGTDVPPGQIGLVHRWAVWLAPPAHTVCAGCRKYVRRGHEHVGRRSRAARHRPGPNPAREAPKASRPLRNGQRTRGGIVSGRTGEARHAAGCASACLTGPASSCGERPRTSWRRRKCVNAGGLGFVFLTHELTIERSAQAVQQSSHIRYARPSHVARRRSGAPQRVPGAY